MTDDSLDVKVARLQERLEGMQAAILLTRHDLDRRLTEMNEFRAQILEERKAFITSEAAEIKHELIRGRIDQLDKWHNNMDGRMWMLGAVLTVIMVLVNLLFRYWPK